MAKFGAVTFDDHILDALRNDRLVVFAGAGVSMGPPSSLASFWQLATQIAEGTTLPVTEPLDRFLGSLQHRHVAVHERAAQNLSPPTSAPNDLHRNLLRLFGSSARVRLVTTNFDLHFETAAAVLFGTAPEVYRAPALPRGQDFRGIVHVHGSVEKPLDLVLTDSDFGRAYLTEGWARRFLEDVFRTYTVLFVGYSHNDVTVHYLARALPPETLAGRFALTDEEGNWTLLGIQPLRFGPGAFAELYEAVRLVADRVARGALDWQTRLADIARRTPPSDEELIGELDSALRDVHTTRFFTKVAIDPAWMDWVAQRGHVDALFTAAPLDDRELVLATWLAGFAHEHAGVLIRLLSTRQLQLNPQFWWLLGREVGTESTKAIASSDLKRWMAVLLETAPRRHDGHVLRWLVDRCAAAGETFAALRIFLVMCRHGVHIEAAPGFFQSSPPANERLRMTCQIAADERTLRTIWTKHLQPHPELYEPLLTGVMQTLEGLFDDLEGWGQSHADWDGACWRRHAIERHEQDRYAEPVDVLIDIGRTIVEAFTADHETARLEGWVERLAAARSPLLRRLALHAMTERTDLPGDVRLQWLLTRFGLDRSMEHHEIHRLAAATYPRCGAAMKQTMVNAVLALRSPARGDLSAEAASARRHFNWLSWLARCDPTCTGLTEALAPIQRDYPTWLPAEYLDLTHWSSGAEWVGPRSPHSAEALLAEKPGALLEDLLSFQGDEWRGPDRDGLLVAVHDACKQSPQWGRDLADLLTARSLYDVDLWGSLIRGWRDAEQTPHGLQACLELLSPAQLHAPHALDIANFLYRITKDGAVAPPLQLLDEADALAFALWSTIDPTVDDVDTRDWLSYAINHPAGVVVESLVNSLHRREKLSGSAKVFVPGHRALFEAILQDTSAKCGLARSILASQTAFFFDLDEPWCRQHLLPLFSGPDDLALDQCWDGFLVWGRLSSALIQEMLSALPTVAGRIKKEPRERFQRFIEFYVQVVVFHAEKPMQQLLPAFFKRATAEDKASLAAHISYELKQMTPVARQELATRWLLPFWSERLQAVPVALDSGEVVHMLEWLPFLEESFPTGVELSLRSPLARIDHTNLLSDLRGSDVVERYSAETAQLLIHLAPHVASYLGSPLREIAQRLRPLSTELQQHLAEAFARAGVT